MNAMLNTKSNPLIWNRSISMVSGYDEHCYPPKTAFRAGLRYRFAIVMHSDCKNDPEASFDAEFFLALTKAVQDGIAFDRQIISLESSITVGSLNELAGHYARSGSRESEAPHKISYYAQSCLVCEEETEFWNLTGGPAIYHDSRAFSFYTAEDRFEDFASRCAAVCAQFEVEAPMRHWGEDFKRPFPWYKWPLRWLAG